MWDGIESYRSRIRRRAISMEIGGFRPSNSLTASWFGRAGFALYNETWPTSNGKPMHALCQINLTELPFRPPRLDDLEFITVFIGPDDLPTDAENGTKWCLRAYRSLNELVRLETVQTGSPIKPFPMRPIILEGDYPCREDVPSGIPPEIGDRYSELCPNNHGFKLGGWPSLIQSTIFWAPGNAHPIAPEYVFQIDSTTKGNWMWGDCGTAYFGRGTVPGRTNEWALEWQCC